MATRPNGSRSTTVCLSRSNVPKLPRNEESAACPRERLPHSRLRWRYRCSGVTGTGEIIRATASFTLTIKLTGMTPNSSHVSHLHAGRCGVPGGIVYALQQVIADSSGAATTTSTLPAEYLVPAFGWYVNVHQGPDFTEPEYAPSASCGDL